MNVGIAAYECRFPVFRLSSEALAAAGVAVPSAMRAKRVAAIDEDALTLAIAASSAASPGRADLLALASTTLPYRRKAQAGLLARALGLEGDLLTLECTTSARAGTEALVAAVHAVVARTGAGGDDGDEADDFRALVVAAEAPKAPVGARAEVAAGAGAVALLLQRGGDVATIEDSTSFAAEDPGLDFVRAGEDARRDIEVPDYAVDAYVKAVRHVAGRVLDRLGRSVADYRFVALDHPSPRLVAKAAGALGLEREQWRAAAFPETGDTGAARSLLELAAVLDAAEPGDRILLVGYGSGSAADAISLEAGPGAGRGALAGALARASDVDFVTYLELRGAT